MASAKGFVPISSLYINDENPRKIDKNKFKTLLKSVFEFPEMLAKRPVVADADGMVLGGNQRFSAILKIARMREDEFAKFAGDDYPAIWAEVRASKSIPSEWVAFVDDFTDEQKKRFVIADNNEAGDWDFEKMLQGWDFSDVKAWGIEVPSKFLVEARKSGLVGAQIEGISRQELFVKTGDLIEIGPHRIVCGDAIDESVYNALFGTEKATLVFTDPPYGVNYVKKKNMLALNGFGKELADADIEHDAIKSYGLEEILEKSFSEIKKRCSEDCSYFIFSPSGEMQFVLMKALMKAYLPVRHVIIWLKNRKTFSMGRLDYDYRHELILFTFIDKHRKSKKEGKYNDTVWEAPAQARNDLHPTIKPVELIENAILNHTDEGEIVADIFLGSGSTIVAAHNCARRGFGIEINPVYCQTAIYRMLAIDETLDVKINGQKIDPISMGKKATQ